MSKSSNATNSEQELFNRDSADWIIMLYWLDITISIVYNGRDNGWRRGYRTRCTEDGRLHPPKRDVYNTSKD